MGVSTDCIETKEIYQFTEKAYFDYSMYVILDRALPHLADGLKPVQRRIVYAMSELHLNSLAKYKKSARTVGDVLGKFHPHGDSACYEAMVLMAQPFSYRYPLIDGQGNWGSTDDPKSFAAMRYTEARLSNYADILLQELDQGTVTWVDNFDGTLKEPELLPAQLPNILLNGASGIAVGMASDVLPHNLTEVANACIHLLEHPSASLHGILKHIKGPDFPTTAEIITPIEQIHAAYEKGIGSLKMRATYSEENHCIVINSLPYQVSGAKIIEQVALQLQQKKLPQLEDIRDESDHENPVRLVLVPRSTRIDLDGLMSHLFATTDLETSYRMNFNMIGLDGKPRVYDLLGVLNEWLVYRTKIVRTRLEYQLDKILKRIHILEGFMIAYLNIDEVIAIIRDADDPALELQQKFKLSEAQVFAILEIKLRQLAKLEEIKIKAELEELNAKKKAIKAILKDEDALKEFIKNELIAIRDKYGDARRSPIVAREEAQSYKETEYIPNEPITVMLSEKGWVKSSKGYDFKGDESAFKAGDKFKCQINARSNHAILFFDAAGRVYSLPAHNLPSARGQGEPLSSKLNPEHGKAFVAMASGQDDEYCILVNTSGYGFVAKISELQVKNKNGKACMNLPANSNLLAPIKITNLEEQYLAMLANNGNLLVIKAQELPILAKGKGNKMLSLSKTTPEQMTHIVALDKDSVLVLAAGKRQLSLKPVDWINYLGNRGKKGKKLPRGLQTISAVTVDSGNN